MTLTTRQVAEELGVPQKRLRYFLRKTGVAHTTEGRYSFQARELRRLKKQYEAWHA